MYSKSTCILQFLSTDTQSCSYAEFVLISKEISVLENELLDLKESLQEWKSMPSLLHIEESASAAGTLS